MNMAAGGSKRGRFLEEFRGRLLAHRRALFEDFSDTQDDLLVLEAAERGEPEVVERAQADSLARLLARLEDRQQAELRELQNALGRIVAGTYGSCERCGREITRRRLEALPWTPDCVDCGRAVEEESRQSGAQSPEPPSKEPPVPPDYANLSDEEIVEAVREELRAAGEEEILRNVHVHGREGRVSLEGEIASEQEREIALEIIADRMGFPVDDRLRIVSAPYERPPSQPRGQRPPPGERLGASTTFESRNPASGELLERFDETTDSELDAVLERSEQAFRDWRERSFAERARPLSAAARLLRDRKTAYARTMALEMGKPIVQGEAEAEKCAWVCEFYAERAEGFLADEPRPTEATRSYVRFEPLGPVLAVMPWNFPFWQVFRFAAPALAAGNAAVLKHASNVPRCALTIDELLREAGFPDGLFQTVLVAPRRVADLLRDRRIRAATLTGSERAGAQVAEAAGRELKKTVLELGGSDPFIVLRDADVAAAASTAAAARL